MNRPEAIQVLVDFALARGGQREFAAAWALSAKSAKSADAPASERGLKFADWFRSTLAPEARLGVRWREDWARVFDDLVGKDGRTPEEIARVCQWARADSFWQGNFLSPRKLRERKDGMMYFDRFKAQMQGSGKATSAARKAAAAEGEYGLKDGQGPKVFNPLKGRNPQISQRDADL